MDSPSLPIEEIRGELLDALQAPSPRILLKAPTGSGKSTGVPPMMDDAGLGERGLIVVVQPRRMAARLLARHVARLRGVELGKEVGYVVRFERHISPRTRIAYVTDGMLERWLTERPALEGVSAVVFDEFHERSLSGDLSLGRVLDLQEGPRPDMAVAVMSATLEYPPAGLHGRLLPGAGGARKAVSRRNRLPGSPAGQRWTRQGIPPSGMGAGGGRREGGGEG